MKIKSSRIADLSDDRCESKKMLYVIEYAERAPGVLALFFETFIHPATVAEALQLGSTADLVGEPRTESEHDDGGKRYPASITCERSWADREVNVCVIDSSSVALNWQNCPCACQWDLSTDFGGPTFSLSVTVAVGGGNAPTSANDAEETMCE